MRTFAAILSTALIACSGELPHDSPYDADAPLDKQARAELVGSVTLEAESDFSQVGVELQNDERTYLVQTKADGNVRLTGVVPGKYQLRIGTRHFDATQENIEIRLGEIFDFGARALGLKRTAVTGNALIEYLQESTVRSQGGVVVALEKIGSIRNPNQASGSPFAASAQVAGNALATSYQAISSSSGSFSLSGVSAGVYRVTAMDRTGATAAQAIGTVTVSGETPTTEIEPFVVKPLAGYLAVEGMTAGEVSRKYTSTSSVTLKLAAINAKQMKIAVSSDGTVGGCVFGAAIVFAEVIANYALPGTDGTKLVCVKFIDAAANETSPFVASIALDRTAPPAAGTNVRVNNGSPFTTSLQAALVLSAADVLSGLGGMKVAQLAGLGTCAAALSSAQDEPYVTVKAWLLDAVAEPQYVCAAFQDGAGNWSLPVSTSVVYDTQAPIVSGSGILINDNAAYASEAQVQLALTVTGATEMLLGNEGSFAGSAWEPYRSQSAWFLQGVDGSREVSVMFRDAAGNVAGPYNDLIVLDSFGPTSPSVAFNPPSQYASQITVSLTLSIVDTAGTLIQVSNDGIFDTEPLQSFASPIPWTLLPGDGAKAVYVRYQDVAGNLSETVVALIILDTQSPGNPGVILNGGADYTNTPNITLALSAVGATEMYIAEAAGCSGGGSWIGYTASLPFLLTSGQGNKSVFARFRDDAGNATACVTDSVFYDSEFWSPGLSAALVGAEGIAGRTKSQVVTIEYAGLSTDASEWKISNQSGFFDTSWSPVTTPASWLLLPGDGLKTVYVKFRDPAGNESARLDLFMELDQTGPDAPGLQLRDLDNDGFAVGTSSIELAWSLTGGDVANFELQRFVQGVNAAFSTIAVTTAAVNTYVDAVTEATAGFAHHYRVRATDELGNISAWSVETVAHPISPIEYMTWTRSLTGHKYHFVPQRGTFSLRPSYQYEETDGTSATLDLNSDVPHWSKEFGLRPYNEVIATRVTNSDNSIAFFQTFPTGISPRLRVSDSYWTYGRFALDKQERAHIVYSDYGGGTLRYVAEPGQWASETLDGGALCPAILIQDETIDVFYPIFYDAEIRHIRKQGSGIWGSLPSIPAAGDDCPSLQHDSQGHFHVAFYDPQNGDLKYANDVTGDWAVQTVDELGDVGHNPTLRLGAGDVAHIVYQDTTNALTKYANNTTGGWLTETILAPGAFGSFSSLDLDSTGVAHVAMERFPDGLFYATNPGGVWAVSPIDPLGRDAQPSIEVDALDEVHISYWIIETGDLMHAFTTSGAWQIEPLDLRGAGENSSLLINADGDLHVLNRSKIGLYYQRRASTRQLISSVGPSMLGLPSGGYSSLAVSDGTAHLFASNKLSQLEYGRQVTSGWEFETVSAGPYGHVSLALDQSSAPHAAWVDSATQQLTYAHRVTGAWQFAAIETGDTGYGVQLRLDGAGKAHLGYTTRNDAWVRYASNVSGSWNVDTVDVEYTVGTSIALDSTGRPHMSYCPYTGEVRHGVKTAAGWMVTALPLPFQCLSSSIQIGKRDDVHIATGVDLWGSGPVYYLTNQSGVWAEELVVADAGGGTILWLDDRNKAHIVYLDFRLNALRYATNDSGGWDVTTIASSGRIDGFSFALDQANSSPHAVYYDFYANNFDGEIYYLRPFHGRLFPTSTNRVTGW